MGFHGGGWFSYLSSTDEKPKVTVGLLRRVLGYSKPYRWQLVTMLLLILVSTGLTLLTPLILRDLIDKTIPSGNVQRLVFLALALLLIPAIGGVLGVIQRRLNAVVGEGVIYDLRVALYSRLQRMSLHFFTNTRLGELMSRLNNDVVGAQNAISNTIVSIITNIIQAGAVLVVMLTLEWRLTLISIIILPLFILAARQYGRTLARYLAPADGSQCPDECHDERNPQHWRSTAGQAVWAGDDRSQALRRPGVTGARSRHRAGLPGRHLLHHHRPGERSGDGPGIWHRRLPGDAEGIHHRHHRRLWGVHVQPVQRPGRV